MSLRDDILKILNTPKFQYKGISINSLFLPVFDNNKKQSVRNRFNELYKDGYLEKRKDRFFINKKGLNFLNKNKYKKLKLKNFGKAENPGPKNLLLLYDIPENKKGERDWFRRTLIKFGFVMIQRSVWVGPSPLPKEFLNYIKLIGLKDSIKTFKLEKEYNT